MSHSAPPVRTPSESSFHDLMAEQLRHAPWLLVSALAHLVVLLFVWLLMPPAPPREAAKAVAVALPESDPDVAPPPTMEPPVVEPDDPTTVQEPLDPAPAQEDPAAASDAQDSADVADGVVDAGASVVGLGPLGALRPVGVPGLPGGRGRGPGQGGGSGAVPPALDWLQKHQDHDGKWDCDGFMKHDTAGAPCDGAGNPVHDVGVTGLALLAFLGEGSTLRSGPHRETIKRGVAWLRSQQQENGLFGTNASHDFVYDHAIATYAMCEAFGLSAYETLRPVAQRGIDYLQAHRNPYGAWRYQPRDGDSDTSVTGWCVMALCSGQHFGLVVDRNALTIATTYLESCTAPDGHLGYQRVGEPSARKPGRHGADFPPGRTEALTAVGLFCRFFLGQDPAGQPQMRAAAARLSARLPAWDHKGGTIDFYYWYYGSYAMFQVGGQAWREWSQALAKAVAATQCQGGNQRGSWDAVDAWGEDGGRVYSTALLALTLQAYYRYGRLVPGSR